MKRILSITKVGLAVAGLLLAVAIDLAIVTAPLDLLTSLARLFEILASLMPFALPMVAGIIAAWLTTKWRGPIVGFIAGAFVIELGYIAAAELSMYYSEPNPDAGLILFLPIYIGPTQILGLAGGMYLVRRWRTRAHSKRLSS